MRYVTIVRDLSLDNPDQGTFGKLTTDSGFSCVTGELPDRANRPNVSRIPEGTYPCSWRFSPSHNKNVYHVDDVPGRSDVEIHSGNYCGDVTQGYKSDVLGCIILGNEVVDFGTQSGVSQSRTTLAAFEADLNTEPFQLTITHN